MLKLKWETNFVETEVGNIPKDWKIKKLKDVADLSKGISYKSTEINSRGEGYLFITLNNFLRGGGFKKEFKYYIGSKIKENQKVFKGDLIIALTDMTSEARVVGAPAIVDIPTEYKYGVISLDCAKIIPKVDFSKYYLYLYLKFSQEENSTFANGVNVLHLNTTLFNEHKNIIFPPLDEQKRIAIVLSWFDKLIENKKKQNEILEKTAMAIFKSWFIDFDPFKEEEFVDSELGKIPKGWDIKPIGELAEFLYGRSLPERKRRNGPYPVVGSSGIIGYHSKYLVAQTSIVLGRKGNAGSVHLILGPSFPIDTVFYSSENTLLENIFYLYFYLKNYISLEDIGLSDTAVPGLNIHILNSIRIIAPPFYILRKFYSIIEPLYEKIALNQREIRILEKVRDALLPLLVFGKLRVDEI